MPHLKPYVSSSKADVVIRCGSVNLPPMDYTETQPAVHVQGNEVYLCWERVVAILVKDGHEIIVELLRNAVEDFEVQVVQGVALGILLDQRGLFTLHASAVAIDGEAVAFIGAKGWGKSTMAAALHARGHNMITDDILVVTLLGSEGKLIPAALPGLPHFKLWPEAVVASLGEDPEALPKIFPLVTKRVWSVRDGYQQTPLPLRCIFQLDYVSRDDTSAESDLTIEPISYQAACVELIKHSYALRFLRQHGTKPAHLRQCAQLAHTVPIHRLLRKPSLKRLTDIAVRIEEELAHNKLQVA